MKPFTLPGPGQRQTGFHCWKDPDHMLDAKKILNFRDFSRPTHGGGGGGGGGSALYECFLVFTIHVP